LRKKYTKDPRGIEPCTGKEVSGVSSLVLQEPVERTSIAAIPGEDTQSRAEPGLRRADWMTYHQHRCLLTGSVDGQHGRQNMANSDALRQLFPQDGEIPADHRPPPPIHQRAYLVNGELKTWDGPVDAVRSPVCVRTADGRLEQIELGSVPSGAEQEAV
jgi:hypothetical protein